MWSSCNYNTGIWIGMLTGTFLQMSILLAIIFTTKWDKQAALAEVRMAEWGGKNENLPLMETTHTADFSADTKYHLDLIFHGQSITMFQASTLLLRTPNNKMRPTNRVGLGGYEQDGWEEGHGLTGRRRRRPRRRGRRPRRRAGRPRRRGRRPRR
ncbi:uncharacterized protein LOC110432614 [Sorghum bicolor]|uniref:uncharacterized protein LOC110432614 n=1 Tax=Sorghum bicolor TaxID=4558 RepID=UPI000B42512A|nr:uncharacterized protein LOC110432614 [Sorghum bicolor]|eukprot:XP_021309051.1 uncharacterized protein LOC110432614 [Sorghum bicolor]